MGPTIAGAIGEAIRVQRGTLLAPPAPHSVSKVQKMGVDVHTLAHPVEELASHLGN